MSALSYRWFLPNFSCSTMNEKLYAGRSLPTSSIYSMSNYIIIWFWCRCLHLQTINLKIKGNEMRKCFTTTAAQPLFLLVLALLLLAYNLHNRQPFSKTYQCFAFLNMIFLSSRQPLVSIHFTTVWKSTWKDLKLDVRNPSQWSSGLHLQSALEPASPCTQTGNRSCLCLMQEVSANLHQNHCENKVSASVMQKMSRHFCWTALQWMIASQIVSVALLLSYR